jgi:ribonuclease VapC
VAETFRIREAKARPFEPINRAARGETMAFTRRIKAAERCLVPAMSVLEAGILAESRRGPEGARDLDGFLQRIDAEVVPFDAEQADTARLAFRAYGKGRHPAGLNFGDCAAYALAKAAGEPLLFKGDDFTRTDITPALAASGGVG